MVKIYLMVIICIVCLFLGFFIGRWSMGSRIGTLQIDTRGDKYIYRFIFDDEIEDLPGKTQGILRINSDAELNMNEEYEDSMF